MIGLHRTFFLGLGEGLGEQVIPVLTSAGKGARLLENIENDLFLRMLGMRCYIQL